YDISLRKIASMMETTDGIGVLSKLSLNLLPLGCMLCLTLQVLDMLLFLSIYCAIAHTYNCAVLRATNTYSLPKKNLKLPVGAPENRYSLLLPYSGEVHDMFDQEKRAMNMLSGTDQVMTYNRYNMVYIGFLYGKIHEDANYH
ncbi:hypothetical protein ACJX0J_008462, partial [Zea mays]